MRVFLVACLALAVDASCQCAPLASCVVFPNGSRGCHCPFFGDGVVSCSEQRFVTHATIRVKQDEDISTWLGHLGRTPTAVSWRRLLSAQTQAVLELDSTDYEGMQALTREINARSWPYEVALLGSATSQIASLDATDAPAAQLEVLNVTFANATLRVELAATAGLIFIASEVKALPCVHVLGECCIRDFTWSPYTLGGADLERGRQSCEFFDTNVGVQSLAPLSSLEKFADGTVALSIHREDLAAVASVRTADDFEANFSVGVLVGSELLGAAQTFISFRHGLVAANYTIGSFQRQVAQYVLLQLEQVRGQTYARLWARVTLENATVVFAQYAWGDMDWIAPRCVDLNETCYDVPPVCQAQSVNSILELWVPVHDWSDARGNLTLYIVIQQGNTLARIMTQASPVIMSRHCASAMQVSDQVDIEILQGLTLTRIYRGPALAILQLGTNAQTDVLITFIARNAAGLALEDLQAIHSHTEEQRALVLSNQTCADCVVEQLVLAGRVVSPRSCHVFGDGDDLQWIQNYVGLVGSALAVDVLGRVPQDVRLDPQRVAAAWINPTWPWKNDSVITDMTFLQARFSPVPRSGRRLLMDIVPFAPPLESRQLRVRPELVLVGLAATSTVLWAAYDYWYYW